MAYIKRNLSLIVLISVLIVGLCYEFVGIRQTVQRVALDSGWEVLDANKNWSSIGRPCFQNSEHVDTKQFRVHLPKTPDSATVFLKSYGNSFEVFQRGQMIYSFPDYPASGQGFLGFPCHSIEIGKAGEGEILEFSLKVNKGGIVGFCESVYLEPSSERFRNLMLDNIERTITALIAVSLAIYSIFFSFSTGQFKLLLSFSGFAFSFGIWIFSCVSGPYFKH